MLYHFTHSTTNTYYQFEDSEYHYLIRFFNYKLRGDTSPLSLERENIRDLIINRRKVELIQQMREDAVNKAYEENEVEWVK
jgi:hypothetical protein